MENEYTKSLKLGVFDKEFIIETYDEDESVSKIYYKDDSKLNNKDLEITEDEEEDEDEDESDNKNKKQDEVTDPKLNKMLKDYYKEESQSEFKDVEKVESDELEKFANKVFKKNEEEDKVFNKFKKIVSYDGDQIIRYCRGQKPLWFRHIGKLDLDKNNKCPTCKSKLIFEFQVRIVLLSFLLYFYYIRLCQIFFHYMKRLLTSI